jgi:hypothetical protein
VTLPVFEDKSTQTISNFSGSSKRRRLLADFKKKPVVHVAYDASSVSIQATNDELDKRMEAFLDKVQEEINRSNKKEFRNSLDSGRASSRLLSPLQSPHPLSLQKAVLALPLRKLSGNNKSNVREIWTKVDHEERLRRMDMEKMFSLISQKALKND